MDSERRASEYDVYFYPIVILRGNDPVNRLKNNFGIFLSNNGTSRFAFFYLQDNACPNSISGS